MLALFLGFPMNQAASIGIIGAIDGPTAIYVSSKLAPDLLGPIAVAAYSYMSLVPIIQPPVMRLLTTDKERRVRMPYTIAAGLAGSAHPVPDRRDGDRIADRPQGVPADCGADVRQPDPRIGRG